MAPLSVKEDFPNGHMMVGVSGVHNVDGEVKVVAGDSYNWDHDEVVEIFVVVSEKVAICLGFNQHDNTTEGELNMGNCGGWFCKKKGEELVQQHVVGCVALDGNGLSGDGNGLVGMAEYHGEEFKGGNICSNVLPLSIAC